MLEAFSFRIGAREDRRFSLWDCSSAGRDMGGVVDCRHAAEKLIKLIPASFAKSMRDAAQEAIDHLLIQKYSSRTLARGAFFHQWR